MNKSDSLQIPELLPKEVGGEDRMAGLDFKSVESRLCSEMGGREFYSKINLLCDSIHTELPELLGLGVNEFVLGSIL